MRRTLLGVLGIVIGLCLGLPAAASAAPGCDPLMLPDVHGGDSSQGQLQCDDPSSSGLNFTVGDEPDHGSASVDGAGFVTYFPDFTYSGPDSFTISVTDNAGGSTSAAVSVDVVNSLPVCHDLDLGTAQRDEPVQALPDCEDADGDLLTPEIVTQPEHGTATYTAGQVKYTPDPGFVGFDQFTYGARDAVGPSKPATVTVSVQNDAPSCDSVSLSTAAETPVTIPLRCRDDDGDDFTLSITSPPPASTGAVGPIDPAAGSVVFTPAPGFSGNAVIGFIAVDEFGAATSENYAIVDVADAGGPVVPEPPADDAACATARKALAKRIKQLKRLRKADAPAAKIKKAKKQVKKAKGQVRAACE